MDKKKLLEMVRRVIKQELNEALTPEEKEELEKLEYEFTSDVRHDSAISPSLYKRYKELKANEAKTDEARYPVAGENGYIRVSQLKKGDILGGSGLEIVNMSSGAMTPSGKIEVTVKDPKTGKELTKTYNKSTTVRLKDKTNENAPAPSKPKEKPGPAVAPGKPGEKPKPRRTFEPKPGVKPAIKNIAATMEETKMLDKIVKRFRSSKPLNEEETTPCWEKGFKAGYDEGYKDSQNGKSNRFYK